MKVFIDIGRVYGGAASLILYPVVGCAGYAGFVYVNNPDASGYELARGCGKGAVHSLNPGLGLAGRAATTQIGRYACSLMYSDVGNMAVDRIAPPYKNQYTCSASATDFIGGFDE